MKTPSYLHAIALPTPFPVGDVNVYLAEGEPLTLVDTGPRYEPARQALHEGLAALGYAPADLDVIVLTHPHSDHCGLAAELAAASGARVLTHPLNVSQLADYAAERTRRLAFYAALLAEAGVPHEVVASIDSIRRGYGRFAEPVTPDGMLEEGMVLSLGGEKWRVLHTPGHTSGLICLYQPERRLLLSSDHLLRDVSSNPFVEPPLETGGARPRPLLDYIAQLQRVVEMDVALALPGHGPPIDRPRELVAERMAFHQARAAALLARLQQGPATVYELTLALFPHLDPINRFLAVSEVMGHLDLLEAQGQVMSRCEGSLRIWQAC